MRLPSSEHTSRPWRIHEIAGDFRVEGVWALPTPAAAEEFGRLVDAMASGDPAQHSPWPVRTLYAIRWNLGERPALDITADGLGTATLRHRLPADLRDGRSGRAFRVLPFTP